MVHKMTLSERCRIHADKMQGEGWYVTANVLAEAADHIDLLEARQLEPEKLVNARCDVVRQRPRSV